MSEPVLAKPIVIDSIDNQKHHLDELGFAAQVLAGCYFYPMSDGTYSLFSKGDMLLKSKLTNGVDFDFDLGPFNWGVWNFAISVESASGEWVVNTPGLRPVSPFTPGDADDEGTFQAQAGGHGQVPEQSAAAGSSY